MSECKGIFYKCKKSVFINSIGMFIRKFYLRPMKRMSCKGCEDCDFIKSELINEIKLSGDVSIEKLKPETIYQAVIIPEEGDDYRVDFIEKKG